jgi:hypothetical protein
MARSDSQPAACSSLIVGARSSARSRARRFDADFSPLSKRSFKPIQCWPLSLGADMRRREFISLLGSAAAWPITAEAQQPLPRRVGVLLVGLSPESKEAKQFRLGLRDAGYSEGRDSNRMALCSW